MDGVVKVGCSLAGTRWASTYSQGLAPETILKHWHGLVSLNRPLGRFSLYFAISSVVCRLCVSFVVDWIQVDWKLFVEERIAKNAKLRTLFFGRFQ